MNHELRKKIVPIVHCSLFIILFLLRLQFQPKLNLLDGQLIRVTGVLREEPQASGNRQSFRLGRVQILTDRYPEYHYGDRLELIGKVKSQERNGFWLSYPEVKALGAGSAGAIKSWAISLNRKFRNLYARYFPQPLDGIVAGIVLGDKSLIPSKFWEQLQQTGTLHIMVASGMNIAFLAGNALVILNLFFKRRSALGFLFILIWFYTLMTGFTPPVVRAAVMASLVYLGQLFGREARGERILLFTGGIMLFVDPNLIFDVGFQLSFLATAGLVFIQPILQKGNFWLFKQENFASTVSAQLMTLPVLLANFGSLNLASPLINLAVLWLIPFILQAGILTGLLGLLWTSLGNMASYLLYLPLIFIKQTVFWSAKMDFFQLKFPVFKGWFWAIYYLLLLIWVKKNKNPKQNPKLR